MLFRTQLTVLSGVLLLVTSCDPARPISPSPEEPILAKAPADGNGNKLVFTIDQNFTAPCDDQLLAGNQSGWFQVRGFAQSNNGNVELAVFHLIATFTNPATGETFVFQDVGPERVYMEDGDLIVAVSGRAGGWHVIGHLLFNFDTEQVEFIAGKEFERVGALACEALT